MVVVCLNPALDKKFRGHCGMKRGFISLFLLIGFLGFGSVPLKAESFVRIRIEGLNGRTSECFLKKCNNLWCKIRKNTYARVIEQGKGPGVRVQLLAKNAEDFRCCGLPVWVYGKHVEAVPHSEVPSDLKASPIPADYLGTGVDPSGQKEVKAKKPEPYYKLGTPCKGCDLDLMECRARKSKDCVKTLKKFVCCDSPWRDEPMADRLHFIFHTLGEQLHNPAILHSSDARTQKRRDLSFVDKYTVACLILKETGVIDPLSITQVGCGINTASGLGHVNKPTMKDLIKEGFDSAYLPRHAGESNAEYFKRLWRNYGKKPKLQLEVLVAVMRRKAEFTSLAWNDYAFLDTKMELRKDQWTKRKLVRMLAHYYGYGDPARLQKMIEKLRVKEAQASTEAQKERIERKIGRLQARIPDVEKETLRNVKPIVACSECMQKESDAHPEQRDNCIRKIKKHFVIYDTNGPNRSPVSLDVYLHKRYCKKLKNAMGQKVNCP